MARVLVILAGVLAALGFLACGGGDEEPLDGPGTAVAGASGSARPPTPTPPPTETPPESVELPPPCEVLRPQDVTPYIGAAPEPMENVVGPFASCAYWGSASSFVQFQMCRCLQGEALDLSLEGGAATLGVELREVEGLGEKAFWIEGILWVQQGDTVFNVWISRPEYFGDGGTPLSGDGLFARALPDARALAETLLSRLD